FKLNRYFVEDDDRTDELDNQFKAELMDPFLTSITHEIFKLTIKQASTINDLDVGYVGNNLYPLYHFIGTNLVFKNITVLYCEPRIDPFFFHELARICFLLQSIYIRNCRFDNFGLAKLITVQKNLKYIACIVDDDDEITMDLPHSAIGKALIDQANSIKHLKMSYKFEFFLPLHILSKLNHLQSLELYNYNDSYRKFHSLPIFSLFNLERQLELASFPQLEVLKIGKVKLQSAIKLIEKTEGNLSEILLGCTVYDEKYSGSFLRTIYKYCPNIQVLSLGINNVIDFKELVTLLRNCKQIRKIIVDRSKESGREHTVLLL
ncbi:130_t:CDS:1, partial [Funneliformis geosporum]